jgi:hypothetical protein
MTETKTVLETLEFCSALRRLVAQEDFARLIIDFYGY